MVLLIADGSWSGMLFSSRTLGIALWAGLAALSLAFLKNIEPLPVTLRGRIEKRMRPFDSGGADARF